MNINRKWIFSEALLVLSVLSILLYVMFPKFLKAQNINTPENFPDPAFRAAVERYMGVEPGGRFSYSETAKKKGHLICSNRSTLLHEPVKGFLPVKNLQGIQVLKSIQKMEISDIPSLELDFSQFEEITQLVLVNVNLQQIDLSQMFNLEYLICKSCNLMSLDITNNNKLKYLDCSGNAITSLDLSQNPSLEILICDNNPIQMLNLSQTPKLRSLDCKNTQIDSLDVSDNPQLRHLNLRDNRLTHLDISSNLQLEFLDLTRNQFSDLPNLQHHTQLSHLNLEFNNFDCKDLAGINAIEYRFTENANKTNDGTMYLFDYQEQNECDMSECEEKQ